MSVAVVNGAQVIAEAESHLGEDGSRFQAAAGFGRDDAWCAMFARFCALAAGATWFPETAYVPTVVTWAQQNGCWWSPTSNPPLGSFVIFDWDGDGLADHIGIVTGYLDDGRVETIEGNAGGPDNSTSTVKRWNRGRDLIEGFLAIDSTTSTTSPTQPTPAQGDLSIVDNDTKAYLDAQFALIRHEMEARSNYEVASMGDVIAQLKSAIATGDTNASNNVVAFLTAVVGQSKDEIIASANGMKAAALGVKP